MAIPQTIVRKLNVCTGQEVGTKLGGRASGRTTAHILCAIGTAMATGKCRFQDHADYDNFSSLKVCEHLRDLTIDRIQQMGLRGFKLSVVREGYPRPVQGWLLQSYEVLIEFSPTEDFVYELRK